MRHSQRDARGLHYCVSSPQTAPDGERTDGATAPMPFRAHVQPLRGSSLSATYGQRLPATIALYGASAPLHPGVLVWVDAGILQDADYAVTGIERFAREMRYTLERRGGFGG